MRPQAGRLRSRNSFLPLAVACEYARMSGCRWVDHSKKWHAWWSGALLQATTRRRWSAQPFCARTSGKGCFDCSRLNSWVNRNNGHGSKAPVTVVVPGIVVLVAVVVVAEIVAGIVVVVVVVVVGVVVVVVVVVLVVVVVVVVFVVAVAAVAAVEVQQQ